MKIKVKVKLNSKQQKIETVDDNNLIVKLKLPPFVFNIFNNSLMNILWGFSSINA